MRIKHVFGPVPSRRLGSSLGIDPVPTKTCNFNCVYCQLGRTATPATRRKPFFNVSDILAEVASVVNRNEREAIDWITFIGSGETTLYSRLGSLIRFVKTISTLPVAVITNGSTLHLPKVRRELSAADAVLPSLDAGSSSLYAAINRPHRDYSFDQHVEGLIEFRKIYQGQLWIEVMILRGINDSTNALTDIASVMGRIGPDEIHLSTPTRPPAEVWVEPPGQEALDWAASIFGDIAKVLYPIEVEIKSGIDGELEDAVLTVVSRHPLEEFELIHTLGHWVPGKVLEALTALGKSGKVGVVERYGKRFWCASGSQFPDQPPRDHSSLSSNGQTPDCVG